MAGDRSSVEFHLRGADVIDALAPLYAELHGHQATAVGQRLGGPPRTAEDAWARRRRRYADWLADDTGFVCVADQEGTMVGYALVVVTGGYDGWEAGAMGQVRDLVVASHARRQGVGTTLLVRVSEELADRGASGLRLNVLAGNDEALAFYRRCGLATTAVTLSARTATAARR